MAWEQIKARDYSDAPVTVAWVKCGGGNSDFRLRVGVPSGVCSRMGLKARDRCNVFRDKATGKLRLVLTKDRRDSYALTGSSKTGALAIRIPLPDLRGKLQTQKESMSVPHSEESVGGAPALVVTLPAWAAPDRVPVDQAAADRARAAADAARANLKKVA